MNRNNYLYKESERFEKRKRNLSFQVVEYIDSGSLKKGFMRQMYDFLDQLVLDMMIDDDDFYASFISKMKKDIDFRMKYPVSSIIISDEIILKINPISFLFLNEREMRGLLKHEIFHIILNHHERSNYLKTRYSKAAVNIAMDIAANQYVSETPAFSLKLPAVNRALDLDMKMNETLEYYTNTIDKALNYDNSLLDSLNEANGFDYGEIHDEWTKGNDLSKEISKERLNSIISESSKNKMPKEIVMLLPNLGKAEINWINEIKNAIKRMPSSRRKTITRRNRRQSERLDLMGELRKYSPEVVVAIDISGSIENEDVRSFLSEIVPLIKYYNRPLRIIECDNRIKRDYMINSMEDIHDISERKGGTAFTPVFELLREEGLKNALLIYFTDGEGEKELGVIPINDTIWVVTGEKLSLSNPNGKVIYLNRKRELQNRAEGLQTMRELLHEWAR